MDDTYRVWVNGRRRPKPLVISNVISLARDCDRNHKSFAVEKNGKVLTLDRVADFGILVFNDGQTLDSLDANYRNNPTWGRI